MSDRTLETLRPRKRQLVAGDLVTWEAWLQGGDVQREADGLRYAQIDRSRLTCFKLVAPGEVLLEAFPPPGASGWNLIYRRRTEEGTSGARRVIFLVAYAPMGPAIMVDPERGTYRTENAFIDGDPDMYPVELLPDEGEKYLQDALTRAT
jgi:hypothetical protein